MMIDTIVWETFHFLRPWWLLALLPLLLVVWIFVNKSKNSGSWKAICDPELLPHILIGSEKEKSGWPSIVLAVTGLLVIIALAGPVWKQLPQPVFRSQSSLVIVLDLSRSMDASDIKPSRLARVKHKILDILQNRKEGQTALVVYAQDAFVVSPLTQDAKTIASLVKSLETNLMPGQGSNTGQGLMQANDLLQQAGSKLGHVLLVTDGVEDPDAFTRVTELTSRGHKISVLAAGTKTGAPIPTGAGGFLKDRNGEIVVPRLEEGSLREIASEGNGLYRLMVSTDADIERLMASFSGQQQNRKTDDGNKQLNVQADVWQEEGPWLLLFVIPLVLLVFRRGYLVMIAVLIMPLPRTGHAFDWQDLWQTSDQQAASAYNDGKHKEAAKKFNNKEWEAASHYKAENYEAAVNSLGGINTPDALYNQATALARSGAIEEAIEYYDRAIELEPTHEDAIYNRDLLVKHQEKKEQQQDQKNDENKEDEQQGEGQDSDKENQDGSKEQQGKGDDKGDKSKSRSDQSEDRDSENADKGKDDEQSTSQKDKNNDSAREDKDGKKQMAEQEDDAGKTQAEKKDKKDKAGKNRDAKDEKRLEMQMANEQWLRRIPDDPGGLLRRKFRYQSQLNENRKNQEQKQW